MNAFRGLHVAASWQKPYVVTPMLPSESITNLHMPPEIQSVSEFGSSMGALHCAAPQPWLTTGPTQLHAASKGESNIAIAHEILYESL